MAAELKSQRCVACDEPTGRCDEDTLWADDDTGPYCEGCLPPDSEPEAPHA